jgi:GMP synthase-like glutamine amidotransferase
VARLVVLQHLDKAFLGNAAEPLAPLDLDERHLAAGDPLPSLDEVDAVLSLGGDQSVREIERYDYLQAEAAFLRAAVDRGVPVLGVCLGGQLLAHALGGAVERMQVRMVEWAEVSRLPSAEGDPVFGALPEKIRALHWNEDAFSVPAGAVELLSRAGPGGEAFRYGESAWGIQFHPEADEPGLANWYADVDWLAEAGVEEEAAREADQVHLPGQRATAERIFGGFARYVAGR